MDVLAGPGREGESLQLPLSAGPIERVAQNGRVKTMTKQTDPWTCHKCGKDWVMHFDACPKCSHPRSAAYDKVDNANRSDPPVQDETTIGEKNPLTSWSEWLFERLLEAMVIAFSPSFTPKKPNEVHKFLRKVTVTMGSLITFVLSMIIVYLVLSPVWEVLNELPTGFPMKAPLTLLAFGTPYVLLLKVFAHVGRIFQEYSVFSLLGVWACIRWLASGFPAVLQTGDIHEIIFVAISRCGFGVP